MVFRTGLITANQQVELDAAPTVFHRARVVPDRKYNKHMFRTKLREIGVQGAPMETVIEKLQDAFTMSDLTSAIESSRPALTSVAGSNEMLRTIHWLASSNYHIDMSAEANLSELVIFPMSEDESHGIEDLRLVRFVEDNGEASYYGTYTAYNGVRAMPTMMHTRDFQVDRGSLAEWARVGQQRDGAIPAQDRWQVCRLLADRWGEFVYQPE